MSFRQVIKGERSSSERNAKACLRDSPISIHIDQSVRRVRYEKNHLLFALWKALDPQTLHAGNEGSDQAARMRRLIKTFADRMS